MSTNIMGMKGSFMLADPQGTPSWYKCSLTNALRTVAQKSKSVLPPDVYATIEEAAGRTYIHESYINDAYIANPGQPIHPDLSFVHAGYKASLGNLLSVVGQPGFEGSSRGKICYAINQCLQDILTLVRSKGNDVGRLFKDPEMSRLLANLASVL
ncbi:hypothetical protein RSOLAG1IB_07763 [Rhizoctonia solani AG-1 IB]|uniref:Uncharacterized protein n=1 Tax=Thanatephorus cucumeris (strain AG1-IB / isolate 7/3/14) TaxID=1108050 RepID=A0A0B7FJM2_THACB|nr:hypothetical protein RSOLAG1IB_07763 [Rhizoctonia solani AG-1 IB]